MVGLLGEPKTLAVGSNVHCRTELAPFNSVVERAVLCCAFC